MKEREREGERINELKDRKMIDGSKVQTIEMSLSYLSNYEY